MLYTRTTIKTGNPMKRTIVIFTLGTLISGTLDAALVPDLNSEWGNAQDLYCQSHAINDKTLCLHKSCDENENFDQGIPGIGDERANFMWVATKIHKGGAYFCPMRITASNRRKQDPWTTYHYMSASNDYCVWLCKEGYGGTDCTDNDGDFVCDTSHLAWNCHDNYIEANGLDTNSEADVAMFGSVYRKCQGQKLSQEHNRILTIVGWLDDANGDTFTWTDEGGTVHPEDIVRGAVVRQMMVRSDYNNWPDITSWPVIYPAAQSPEILLCKTGYKPDPISKTCVEISATRCAEQNLCSNYKTGFDETIHTMKITDDDCYEYRCKEQGKAFASEMDRSCIDCPTSMRGGPSSTNGTCLSCSLGEIYNGSSCGSALGFSKTDLMYGKGKTRDSVNTDIDMQCWTILDTDAYKCCVKHSYGSPKYNQCVGKVNESIMSSPTTGNL